MENNTTTKLTEVTMSKQTAVDYLVEQLFKIRNNTTEVKEMDINSIIDQAKQMEKEQIIDAYKSATLQLLKTK